MTHLQSSWGVKTKRSLLSWGSASNNRGDFSFSSLSQANGSTSPSRETDDNREDICAWCGQCGISESGVRGHVDGNGVGQQKFFCSDVCFSQCRRAAFKRAKVCDWCKHVRHTVTYVDLNDGQRQLQFCTDKCRNQYKMQLFCAEATSLGVQSCASSGLGGTSPAALIDQGKSSTPGLLITPELWLADCRDGDPTNVKAEFGSGTCSDEGDAASSGSDQEVQHSSAGDAPLNLVHSSRRSSCVSKKRVCSSEERDKHPAPSKKGKSHRKPNSTTINKAVTAQVERNSPLHPIPHLPHPHLARSIWPSFPYSPNLPPPHPSYFLPPHFFHLNQPIKSPINSSPISQDDSSISQRTLDLEHGATDKDENLQQPKVQQTEKQQKENRKEDRSLSEEAAENLGEKFPSNTGLVLPESIVVLRIPTLVPLPIPVPIPIPLNIHEKYLKQVLT